jgi:hypothetical protein
MDILLLKSSEKVKILDGCVFDLLYIINYDSMYAFDIMLIFFG